MPRNPKWPTPLEIRSVITASIKGGNFLDLLNRTKVVIPGRVIDMATLSPDDWFEFILVVVNSYEEAMRIEGFTLTKSEK